MMEQILYFLLSLVTAAPVDPNQIITKDVVGWLVDLLAVVVAAIALIYTAKQIKYEGNAKYVETFKTIEEDLSKIENDSSKNSASGTPARLNWEISLLNNLERLAWLLQSGKYPKEFEDYYKLPFSGALHLLRNSQIDKVDACQETINVCTKKGWSPMDVY